MANDNIAQQLVRGSQNIDRMRAEIRAVINMLSGLVDVPHDFQEKYEFPGGHWSVMRSSSSSNLMATIECWLDGPGWVFWTSASDRPRVEYVELVYDNLHVFVEGMLREFPELERKIAPILKASQKFPSAE